MINAFGAPSRCDADEPQNVIRVGSEIDFPPFALVDEKGAAAGFSVELIQAVAGAMGLSPVISTGTWDEMWNGLAQGRLDVLPLVAMVPSRKALIDFSTPHTETFDAFFVPEGAPLLHSIKEAQGKKLIVMRSDAAHHEIMERKFQGEIVLVDNIPEGLSLLSSGRQGAMLCSKVIGELVMRRYDIKGVVSGPVIPDYKRIFAFGVPKGADELREKLNQGLLVIKANGMYDQIYGKWLGIGKYHPAKQLRTIIVDNYYPYSCLTPQGTPDGFCVDLARAVTRVMDMELEVTADNWQQAVQALQTGRIDFLPMMAYSKERSLLFDFSGPHTIGYDAFFIRKGSAKIRFMDDLRGKRILVMQGDQAHDYLRRSGLEKDSNLVLIRSLPDSLRMLAEDKGDVALMPKLVGLGYIHSLGIGNLETAPMIVDNYDRPFSFAVTKGNQALLEKLSQGLIIIKADGQYQKIYDKWFGRLEPRGIAAPIVFRYALIGILIFSMVAGLLLTWSILLRRQVRSRTKDLQQKILDLKQAESSRSESERRFREMLSTVRMLAVMLDCEGRITYCNSYLLELTGWQLSEVIGRNWFQYFLEAEVGRKVGEVFSTSIHTGEIPLHYQNEIITRQGETRLIDWNNTVLRDEQHRIIGTASLGVDITERKHLESKLKEREQVLSDILESTLSGYWDWNIPAKTEYLSPTFKKMFGYEDHELPNSPDTWQQIIFPEDLPGVLETFDRHVKSRGREPYYNEVRYRHKDGSTVWVICAGRVIEWAPDDSPIRMVGCHVDITGRKQAEEELREREERFHSLARLAPAGIYLTDKAGKCRYVNERWCRMSGLNPQEALGDGWINGLHPEDRNVIFQNWYRMLDSEGFWGLEYRFRTPDGKITWVFGQAAPLRDASGKITGYVGINTDISDLKQAEEEREKLKAQLLQSQKMESVGRLAGGVAHDFNNMLMAIIGNAEISLDAVEPSSAVAANLQEILACAQRSAALTRQLLAFARKQTIIPQVLDLNVLIASMLKMLRRLIGENINLVWKPETDLWPVKLDPSQVDQILVNMAVNARDAISGVGDLIIATQNVVFDDTHAVIQEGVLPGKYVLLAVSDTGMGMAKETLNNIFEPFYTTKEVGKGTGLGLATVYGIIKQNHGFINVHSEPGQGTTFKIYIPRIQSVDKINYELGITN